jgi:hypothetical protein
MSKLPDADNLDAKRDLERALSDVGGVAEVLMELGVENDVAGYLGGALKEHYNTAMDAFRRIYRWTSTRKHRRRNHEARPPMGRLRAAAAVGCARPHGA